MEIGKSRIDDTLVKDGVWTEYHIIGPDREPTVVKLRLALADVGRNQRYKEALRKGLEPYERVLALYRKGADMPASLATKINDIGRRVFAECIVTDWDGPTKNGQPVPYSVEGCIALFAEYPELQAEADADANKFERYRVSALEEAAGN